MILIADCGSTKCDWAVTDGNYSNYFTSVGFNPVHTSSEIITIAIKSAIQDNVEPITIDTIYFYGAGCIGAAIDKVQAALQFFFPRAEIFIQSDLVGAGRALFKGESGIAAILGTGCNSGIIRNGEIVEQIPSMGFILGDEGSGASIGKRMVNAIYKRGIPDQYREIFERETMVTYQDIINGTYRSENPSQFLAQFMPFIHDHINDNVFRNLVTCELDLFFSRNIIRLTRPKDYSIGFVGSVATYFEEILKDVAQYHGLTVSHVLQKPINRLVEYHEETDFGKTL